MIDDERCRLILGDCIEKMNIKEILINGFLALLLIAATIQIGSLILEKSKIQVAEYTAQKTAEANALCPNENWYYYPCEDEIKCEHNKTQGLNWKPNEIKSCGII